MPARGRLSGGGPPIEPRRKIAPTARGGRGWGRPRSTIRLPQDRL